MKALFDPDLDAIADEEDVAAFRRGYDRLGEDHRRILMILLPRLVALQERGDSTAALRLVADIKHLVASEERSLH